MIRWIGILIIISCCGWFGCVMANIAKREVATLKKLITAIEIMICELQYHLTPLPELCRIISAQSSDCICRFFSTLAEELECQIAPDVDQCVKFTLQKCADVPNVTTKMLILLGESLGKYDLDGQISGLISVKDTCLKTLDPLLFHLTNKLKTYRTLGFCAGLTIAIIII